MCVNYPPDHLQMVISQTREKQAGSLNEITWKGKSVPVKNEQVRSFILHSHESTHEVERAETFESKMAVYDQLLMECKDGLQSLKDEMKPDQVSTPWIVRKTQSLYTVHVPKQLASM